MATKICRVCEQEKQLSDFGRSPKTSDQLAHMCRDCMVRRNRAARYESNSRPEIGTVYIFQYEADLLVKIGWTGKSVEKRRTQVKHEYKLRGGKINIIATIEGNRLFEHQLHKLFEEQRVYMDWFKPTQVLNQLIHSNGWTLHNELVFESAPKPTEVLFRNYRNGKYEVANGELVDTYMDGFAQVWAEIAYKGSRLNLTIETVMGEKQAAA